MGLNQVREQPVRDRFVMRDPDIRGLRLRFAPWSSTFTTGSFTFTRASAMLVHPGNGYAALHMARPYLRVAPLETAQKCEPDYGVLPAEGADHTAVLDDNALAVATRYRLMLTPATWSETRPEAPIVNTELWLMTDQGMVGLIDSRATATVEAREFNHQFRFIPVSGQEFAESAPGTYGCGNLRFRVWDTDFPARIVERVRRYCQSPTDRKDWQLALADEERAPEQVAQAAPTADKTTATVKLPVTHRFPADYRRFSLAEISPAVSAFRDVAKSAPTELPGFTVTLADGRRVLTCHNPGDRPAALALPGNARVVCSWEKRPRTVATAASFTVPPGGVVLVRLPANP
jgi:hypothetical protein